MSLTKASIGGRCVIILGWMGVFLAVSMSLIAITMFRYFHGNAYSWFGVVWLVGDGMAITSGIILRKQSRLGPLFLWVGLISFLIGLMSPET